MRGIFVVFLFCMTLCVQASGPAVRFDRLSLAQGLSQSAVAAIYQDSRGFIWFGTEDGLNRYDGYEFKVYKHDPQNPDSISDNHIKSIYQDDAGYLWVGTLGGGLNRYDMTTDKFTRYVHTENDPHSLADNSVWAIVQDELGQLWFGTEGGISKFDGNRFINFSASSLDKSQNGLSHNNVRTLWHDPGGILWIGTYGGGLNRFDTVKGYFEHFTFSSDDPGSLSHNQVLSIFRDSRQVLWVGTEGGGLNRYNEAQKRFSHFKYASNDPYSLSNDEVWSIAEDEKGTIWVATQGGGLNRFESKLEQFYHYRHHSSQLSSLSNDNLWTIYQGRNGLMWIGSNGGGINKFDIKRERFGHYRHDGDDPHSLSHDSVFAFLKDKSGTLWVGTDVGLNRYNEEKQQFEHYFHNPNDASSLSHNWAMALFEDDQKRFWVGTLGGGLNLMSSDRKNFTHLRFDPQNPDSLSDDRVSVIYQDSDGVLWIGTLGGGLNRYDETNDRFIRYQLEQDNPQSLSHNSVMAITQGPDGYLWIGTFDGLNRLDKTTGKFKRYRHQSGVSDSISHNFVTTIMNSEHTGDLWVGTYGGGLNRFDRKTGKVVSFREKDGLANDSIYGILADEEGHLWISTNQGLSHFEPKSRHFENYDVIDGLQSNEFNGVSYYKSVEGELFFGGIDGFNRFFAHDIHPLVVEPNLLFTDFLLFNQSVPISDNQSPNSRVYWLPKAIDQLSSITLSHYQSLFAFEFAALDFTNPDKVRYAYRLEGFNQQWISTSAKNRRATFTSLPPGDYTLKVRASDPAQIWRSKEMAIDIKILPPPWKSWWAYSIYTLILASLLYIVYWVKQYYGKARLQLLANTQLRQVMQAQIIAGQGEGIDEDNASFRVLVVDDQLPLLEQLKRCLLSRNYRITTASSGNECLQLIENEGPFDLVLLAVNMPKLSGYQVCERIRFNHSANDLPVIFMTEDNQLGDMMQSFAVGANDYISKPIAEPDLLNRVDTQLKLLEINRNLAQSNQSIKALSEMCTEISSILDLDKLMDTVYAQVKELMDVDAFALGVFDEQNQAITFHLSIEDGQYLPDYSVSISESNRPSVWCVVNQKPMIVNDLERQYQDYFGEQPLPEPKVGKFTRSLMYWPLVVAGRIIGILSVQSYRKNAYDQNQIKIIKTLASTTAIALDHARAYKAVEQQRLAIEDKVFERTQALEQSNQNISTLAEICTEISTTLNFNKILHTVYRRIKDLMDADIFMIGLIDRDKDHIEFKLAIKWDKIMPPFVVSLDDEKRAAIVCINLQSPLVVNNLRTDMPKPLRKLPIHHDDLGREIESFMYFPLLAHGQLIGVLTVQSYRHQAYNEHQQDMIGTIASTTAVALDNARAYRELEQKNNQILATQKKLIQSENLASLGTLTAGIAHEINNPTNFVHVSSQNLEVDLDKFRRFIFELTDDDTDDEIIQSFQEQFRPLFEHISTIKEGTDRIKTIVKDLRGFSYLDTDEKSAVDLPEMLHSTINLAKTKYGQLADFETDFKCDTKIDCYPAQLNQVFMNLIVNACDAIRDKQRAQQKEVQGQVVVGCYCREKTKSIDITFKDNGCGMDEQTMEKLFLPFYTTKKVGEGTGLGLSISYNIVQKHDGELTVKSQPGVGTEFRLRLPAGDK